MITLDPSLFFRLCFFHSPLYFLFFLCFLLDLLSLLLDRRIMSRTEMIPGITT